jgi:dimethylamine monooxygenase subunit C
VPDVVFGVSVAHTSAPRDAPLELDSAGVQHLLVAELDTPATRRLLADAARLRSAIEIVRHADDAEGSKRSPGPRAEATRADEQLAAWLSAASVGVRLYVSGREAFVRRLVHTANRMGLSDAEIRTEISGPRARRVRCVHCKTIADDVDAGLVECPGCGLTLLVYHHYSRRHGAWMGFQADAEVPGELPELS